MTTPERIEGLMGLIRVVARHVAIVLAWIVVVAIATACFFPRGRLSRHGFTMTGIRSITRAVFGSSAAIAGAVATAVSLAIGGKKSGLSISYSQ